MTPPLLQILVAVEVEGVIGAGELAVVLSDQRDEHRGHESSPIDWISIGRAVERIADLVHRASQGRTVHLYVGGQGLCRCSRISVMPFRSSFTTSG